MKKTVFAIMLVIMLCLSACASGNGSAPAGSEPASDSAGTSETPAEDVQTAEPSTSEDENGDAAAATIAPGGYQYEIVRDDKSETIGNIKVNCYYDSVCVIDASPAANKINQTLVDAEEAFFNDNAAVFDYAESMKTGNVDTFEATSDAEVTCDADGIFSIRMTYVWYAGGVRNTMEKGMTFSLETGDKLTVADIFLTDEAEAKQRVVDATLAYMEAHPEMSFFDDAKDTVNAYQLSDFVFYVQDGICYVCYAEYELAPGASGGQTVAIPIQ